MRHDVFARTNGAVKFTAMTRSPVGDRKLLSRPGHVGSRRIDQYRQRAQFARGAPARINSWRTMRAIRSVSAATSASARDRNVASVSGSTVSRSLVDPAKDYRAADSG